MIENIYNNMTFIISFLVLALVLQMFAGNKVLERFLVLVLFSMIIINSGKFVEFISNRFTTKEKQNGATRDFGEEQNTQHGASRSF